MSICEQKPDSDLTQELFYLNNNRTVFFGHVNKLISKIETCIFNSNKVEKSFVKKNNYQFILKIQKR